MDAILLSIPTKKGEIIGWRKDGFDRLVNRCSNKAQTFDLKYFKEVTSHKGHARDVVMGNTTWVRSLRRIPLKGRGTHFVLTHNEIVAEMLCDGKKPEEVVYVESYKDVQSPDAVIIGGAKVYNDVFGDKCEGCSLSTVYWNKLYVMAHNDETGKDEPANDLFCEEMMKAGFSPIFVDTHDAYSLYCDKVDVYTELDGEPFIVDGVDAAVDYTFGGKFTKTALLVTRMSKKTFIKQEERQECLNRLEEAVKQL